MIIYNQAFDLYHCIFRVLHLLNNIKKEDVLEVDRIRIWDFYLLFPEKIHEIRLKQDEKTIRQIRKQLIKITNNPYEKINNNKKIFERLNQYQISALNCIASYGIISKDNLILNKVSIINKDILDDYISKVIDVSQSQTNVISLLTTYFYDISLFGSDGLKSRSNLIESKYDV